MKKIYCDYCGKEIEGATAYVLPVLYKQKSEVHAMNNGVKLAELITGEEIIPIQKDMCPECEFKIATLLGLVDSIEVDRSNPYETSFKIKHS